MEQEDKIIQISGFGVSNTKSTQCDYMVAGLTESGRVVITTGDGVWADISGPFKPKCNHYYNFETGECVHCGQLRKWYPKDIRQGPRGHAKT